MKTKCGRWLLCLGMATVVNLSAMAQGHGGDHRKRHDGNKGRHRYAHSTKSNLSDKVFRITEADSLQKQKMKPAIEHASKRLESLRLNYQKQERRVLDSMSVQVKHFLKEEQLQKLNSWTSRTEK